MTGKETFQHFIITRFNLSTNEFNESSKGGVSNEWMDNRIQIFQDYCYNSVLKQKNQNFTWLVFFDINTAEKHLKIIAELANNYSNFVPIYADGMDDFLPGIKKEITERLNKEFIITSRLDNDDCLHQDYIDSVQNTFDAQEFLVVDFINGLTLKINDEIKCGNRIHSYNPFISLIESTKNDICTIWSKRHGGWGKIKLIKQINNKKPLWLSVVHNENVLNRYIGFDDVDDSTLAAFNIKPKIMERILQERVSNSKFSSLKSKLNAVPRYYLKSLRNKVRATLHLIPDK